MNNKLVVIRGKVQLVGNRMERRTARFLAAQLRRVRNLWLDLARTLLMSRAAAWIATRLMSLAMTAGTQAGFQMLGLLIAAGFLIIGLALFFTRGLPVIYTMSSNTTAMTTAGMSSDAIQWTTWALWGIIIIVIAGMVTLVLKKYGGASVGGGGGGGGRRRRRR